MRYIDLYENFNNVNYNNNKLTIKFSDDTLKDAYWDHFYPLSMSDDEEDRLNYEDYIYSTLDIISGELKRFLMDNSIKVGKMWDKKLKNNSLNINNGTIDLSVGYIDNNLLNKLITHLKNEMSLHFYNNMEIKWDIIYNNNIIIKDSIYVKEYDKMSIPELRLEIDKALDDRNFDLVNKINKYI